MVTKVFSVTDPQLFGLLVMSISGVKLEVN